MSSPKLDADVLVIGSGVGGLTTAALLARRGMSVLVLERHRVAGGLTHTFRRKRHSWDVGVHYVGKVHDRSSPLRALCDHVTGGNLAWAPLGAPYDRVCFPDRTYDFAPGADALTDMLAKAFPGERPAIDAYLRQLRRAEDAAHGFFSTRVLPRPLASLASPILARPFRRYSGRTTADALHALTRNRELAAVLAARWGNYGLPPSRSSFGMHALAAASYLDGASYPVGGAGSIGEHILSVLVAAGGRIRTSADVSEILVRKGRVAGVRLASGEELFAPLVVSDAGAALTIERLLPPEARPRRLLRQLRTLRPSSGHVCLYVGLRGSPRALGLERSNHWVHGSYDLDRAALRATRRATSSPAFTFVSCASAKDPDWSRRHPGLSTLTAVAPAPYDWFARFAHTRWRRRGHEYEELKARLSEQLLDTVLSVYPRARGCVEHLELSTPLSTEHFTGRAEGAMYGLEHGPDRFRAGWLRPALPVAGLFLTGQDIVTVGIGAALMSGVLTSSAILRRNVLSDVLRETQGADVRSSSPPWSVTAGDPS